MRAELQLGQGDALARFVGWAPVPAKARLTDADGAVGPVSVVLRNHDARGGAVDFFRAVPGAATNELQVDLPADGTAVDFHLGGHFRSPSVTDGDAAVDVVQAATGAVIGSAPVTVRVRKDATSLTATERTLFVSALARFNDRGRGRFSDFRNAHTTAGDPEAHGGAGFLPWHRAFLLDLERELQNIDPRVSLPYWKFDAPARNLFSRDFIGASDSNGSVQFSTSNPLQFWATDGTVAGIVRKPEFNTTNGSAFVISEAETLALGGGTRTFAGFRSMEGRPHASAHNSFGGSISSISTAAKDPLFFLLHANVDRLWAKWQWLNKRFDVTAPSSYPFLGVANTPGATRIGHNLRDTMWPWNGQVGSPRPQTAPGGTMASSPQVSAPGLRPTVGSMIDYQGAKVPANRLGFDYDDVPFEFVRP